MLNLSAFNLFAEMVSRPDGEINLGEAALLVAAQEYPSLDIKASMKRLDDMAERLRPRIRRKEDPHSSIRKINHYLFEQEGFRGNSEDYFDPRNSFLNQVLHRKLGIPITLSVVYMEIAQRLGIRIEGIGFPGHFLVKYVNDDEEIIIDPFHGGEILSVFDCQERLDRAYSGALEFQEELLSAATKKQILTRMLTNLKGIYLRKQAYEKALNILEFLICTDPRSAHDVKDRALIYYRLKEFGKAVKDLEQYIKLAPDAHDRKEIRENILLLRRLIALMN